MISSLIIARRQTIRGSAIALRKNSSSTAFLSPNMASFALANRISEEVSVISCSMKTFSINNWMIAAKASAVPEKRTPVVFDIINQQNTASGITTTIGEVSEYVEGLFGGIFNVKRTFQPSLLRRKRKHGFLARAATRHGRDILNRRRAKGRSQLCA